MNEKQNQAVERGRTLASGGKLAAGRVAFVYEAVGEVKAIPELVSSFPPYLLTLSFKF